MTIAAAAATAAFAAAAALNTCANEVCTQSIIHAIIDTKREGKFRARAAKTSLLTQSKVVMASFFVLRLGRKIKFIFSIKTCVRVCFLDFPFIHMPGIKRFLFIFYFSTFPLSEVKFMIMLLEGRQSGKGPRYQVQ